MNIKIKFIIKLFMNKIINEIKKIKINLIIKVLNINNNNNCLN